MDTKNSKNKNNQLIKLIESGKTYPYKIVNKQDDIIWLVRMKQIKKNPGTTNKKRQPLRVEVDNLKSDVKDLKFRVSNLEKRVANLEARVESLEAKVDNLTIAVNNLAIEMRQGFKMIFDVFQRNNLK